jgi:hypothetical protein
MSMTPTDRASMEQVEKELDRIWRRLNALEDQVDAFGEDLRKDIRELRGMVVTRFNGVDGHFSKTNWGSVIATVLAAAAGIGVPVGIALLVSGGG